MNAASATLSPGRLRWGIAGLLFASTVINYIDRQTLAALAPFLKEDYQWTNAEYAAIVIAFRLAYAIGQAGFGRLVDRLGTRRGLALSVGWYSVVAMLTPLVGLLPTAAAIFAGFIVCRFLLGLGESANWPGATKAVAEWFPRRERGWAVAWFDSGSSIGAAVAPVVVVLIYQASGRQWWPAFVITGALGFAWLAAWLKLYHPPETHPRLGEAERRMILEDRAVAAAAEKAEAPPRWRELIRQRRTWGVIAARACTDPVWYLIADWFLLYLVQEKHFELTSTLVVVWVPFLAADLGNLAGGGVSSWLVARGCPWRRARLTVVFAGALGMAALIPAIYATNLFTVVGLFALATFGYAWFCTMALVLPADLFPSHSVASVSGLGGCCASVVTIGATYVIGDLTTTTHSFEPILIAGSVIPLAGAVLVARLIRAQAGT